MSNEKNRCLHPTNQVFYESGITHAGEEFENYYCRACSRYLISPVVNEIQSRPGWVTWRTEDDGLDSPVPSHPTPVVVPKCTCSTHDIDTDCPKCNPHVAPVVVPDGETTMSKWRELTQDEIRFGQMPAVVRCVDCKGDWLFHKATCKDTSQYEVPDAPVVEEK